MALVEDQEGAPSPTSAADRWIAAMPKYAEAINRKIEEINRGEGATYSEVDQ